MLYERWQNIVQKYGDEIALHDLARKQRWTFAELSDATAQRETSHSSAAFPHGMSADFIFTVLSAWQKNRVVCPLEIGQEQPTIQNLPVDCVHLKMTSASTGAARMIAFTGDQLAADAENIVATMGLRRDWPNLGVISLAHSYGFSNLVLPLLLHGIPLILVESPLPENVRLAAQHFDAITLAAVPALWRVWFEANSIPANIRLAISAGAPLPLKLEAEIFARNGLKVHNFYGSSECGGIAYDTSAMPRMNATCVGAPMQNVQLSLTDDGCLEIHSRAVAETYWPEPSETLHFGVFRTSDLAELRDGLVFLRGRASDQINVAGRKVSPESIERILLTHPDIRDCLVFGVPSADVERGEEIIACLATKKCSDPEPFKNFLLAKIPSWQVPRDWWLMPSLETNQRGKLSRAAWRQKYLQSTNKLRKEDKEQR